MAAGADQGDTVAELATFGDLLRYLRRRARLTQRELGLAVGYSEAQISRLEGRHRVPDPTTVAALFLPALRLGGQPGVARRLVELATAAQRSRDEHADPAAAELPPLPTHPVARPAELDALEALLRDERRVVLCGLPGTGKTTLATMLARRRASGRPVCWLTLTSGVTDSVEALVRRLAGVLLRHGQDLVGPLVRTDLQPPIPLDERLRLLAEAMTGQPLLLCLDNGQLLADRPALRRVLAHLLATTVLELLVPSRTTIGLAGVATHPLGGLAPAEGRELIDALGGLPAELVDPLIARTDGSPMLLRLALGQIRLGPPDPAGFLRGLDAHPEVGRYLLDSTVGELSEAGRRLLELIAVFRTPVDPLRPDLIERGQAQDGPYDVLAALAELHHRQLLGQPPATQPHPLILDRVRTGLAANPARARRLHAVAADCVAEVTEAAWHWLRSGRPDRAGRLLAASTTEVINQGKVANALALLDELLANAVDWALLLARADLLAQTEQAADAEAVYRLAGRHAPTPSARWQVAGRLAEYYALRGRPAEVLDLCRHTDPAPPTGVLAARLAAVECRAHMQLADYPETLRAGQRTRELLDAATDAPATEIAEITARVYSATGQALRRLGERGRAEADLRRAVTAARAAGSRTLTGRALFNLAGVFVDTGQLDQAEAGYAEVNTEVRAVGDFHCLARVLHAQGVLRHYRGDPAEARVLHEESLAIQRRLGDLGAVAISRIGLAQALLALDDLAGAQRLLDRPELIEDRWLRTHALDALAMVALVADGGLTPRAEALLSTAGALATDLGADPQLMAMIAVHTALGLLASGRPDEAAELLDRTPIEPDFDVLPVEAAYVRGGIELVAGGPAGVLAAADRISDLVAGNGQHMYDRAAARLRAAATQPPPAADLPRLLWVLT